jgi:hypothetical protein
MVFFLYILYDVHDLLLIMENRKHFHGLFIASELWRSSIYKQEFQLKSVIACDHIWIWWITYFKYGAFGHCHETSYLIYWPVNGCSYLLLAAHVYEICVQSWYTNFSCLSNGLVSVLVHSFVIDWFCCDIFLNRDSFFLCFKHHSNIFWLLRNYWFLRLEL